MFIHKDMIKKEVCDDLINAFKNSKEKIKVDNPYTKMTNTVWTFHHLELHEYFKELNKVLEKYIKKYTYVDKGQEPWNLNSKIQIQKYEPGESYFEWHSESTGFQNTNNRILVFTTYLNDVKNGGETEFFYQKEKIRPEKGKTILFPAFWTHTHKGNIAKQTKYIITGWYTYVH